MATKKKRILSLLLALVLIFGIFAVSASAIVYKTGTASTAEDWVSGTRISGTVTCFSDRASASTSLNKSGAKLSVSACIAYVTPASQTVWEYTYSDNTQNSTSVSAVARKPSGSMYTAKRAYGGHDEDTYGTDHLETADSP